MRSLLLVMVLVAAGTSLATGPAAAASSKPVVQGVSPSSGTTLGGTTVTITGQRFHHVRKVLFGSAPGTSLKVKSATKLTVRAPKHSAGTVAVRVETKAGESAKTAKDNYKYKLVFTPHVAPLPAHATDPEVALSALACGSAGSCVAVGNYLDAKGDQQGLVERLAAGRWTASKAPLPAEANSNPGVTLSSIACPTSHGCIAVGLYVDSSDHVNGLIETLSDSTVTATMAPQPTGVTSSNVQLSAVACHGSDSCAAVGSYADSDSQFQGLLENLASGSWSATEAPLPNDASLNQTVQLVAVACPAAGSCSAVGDYDNPEQVGLVETLSNGAWQAAQAKLPAGASTGFQSVVMPSVGCASSTSCTAVGQYLDSAPHHQGLIESLPVGGTSGSKATVPSDGNPTPFVGLAAVSCIASRCTAIGSYLDKHSAPAGLIEPLSGPGGPTRAPLPPAAAGASEVDLVSISCPAAGSCTLVGVYTDAHGHSQGLFDAQSGTSWHATAAPLPPNAIASGAFPTLAAISCPAKTSCVAIGQYEDSHRHVQGLLETK